RISPAAEDLSVGALNARIRVGPVGEMSCFGPRAGFAGRIVVVLGSRFEELARDTARGQDLAGAQQSGQVNTTALGERGSGGPAVRRDVVLLNGRRVGAAGRSTDPQELVTSHRDNGRFAYGRTHRRACGPGS